MTSASLSPKLYGHFVVTETAAGRRFQFNHTLFRTSKNVARPFVIAICLFFGFFAVMALAGFMPGHANVVPQLVLICVLQAAVFSFIVFGVAVSGVWLFGYRSKTSLEVRPDGLTINDNWFLGGADINVTPYTKQGLMGLPEHFSIIVTAGIRRIEILDIEPDAFPAFQKQFSAACRQIWHLQNA